MYSKTKTFSMFLLGAILVAGTISMAIPSSFAAQVYDSYDDSYTNDYKKHGSNVNIQKAKCNNISIIGTDIPSTSNGDMMNGIIDEDDETGQQAQWSGKNPHGTSDFNRNVVTICNNVNNIIGVGDEEPQTGSLTVKKEIFGCNEIDTSQNIMDCEAFGPDSNQWLSCDNPNDFTDPIFCNGLQKSFFDIQVLDEQDNIVQEFNGAEGTTITNIEPGTQYNVKEIKYPVSTTANQLQAFPPSGEACVLAGFQDGGSLGSTLGVIYTAICIEYEDEEGNDCSTTTIAAGEEKTCIVKNYILNARGSA